MLSVAHALLNVIVWLSSDKCTTKPTRHKQININLRYSEHVSFDVNIALLNRIATMA